MGNTVWFTNLETAEQRKDIALYEKFNPAKYPKYDNYDAIEVPRVAEIPADYEGIMGVPVTFLDKYNPEQFEIVGSNRGVGQDANGIYGRARIAMARKPSKDYSSAIKGCWNSIHKLFRYDTMRIIITRSEVLSLQDREQALSDWRERNDYPTYHDNIITLEAFCEIFRIVLPSVNER